MKKILIVDDEPDVRALLNTRLSANGYEILEAPDGAAGIAVAREEKPDLILLDVLMPSQDGVETYRVLREDPATEQIPVIFLTALSQNVSVTQKNLNLGAGYDILGKPYRAEELIEKVRSALGDPA